MHLGGVMGVQRYHRRKRHSQEVHAKIVKDARNVSVQSRTLPIGLKDLCNRGMQRSWSRHSDCNGNAFVVTK